MPYLCGLWRFANTYYEFYVKGESAFTYEDRGSEAYIIIGGSYYKVSNPSAPPIN